MNQRGIGVIALLLLSVISLTFDTNCAQPSTETIQTSASPLKLGEARGTLTAGGQSIELKFAYARATKGLVDESKQEVEVLLTEKPVPEEILMTSDDFLDTLSRSRDLMGVGLRASTEGKIVYIAPRMRFVKQSQEISLVTNLQTSEGGLVKIDANSIEGKSEKQSWSSGEKWSYSVAFRATILKQVRSKK